MSIRQTKTPPVSPAKPAAEPPRTLAQEKADFTAEGSPPPGQVAGAAPQLPADDAPAPPPPATTAKGAAPARRQPPAPAGPARRSSKRNPTAWRGNG